MYNHSEKKSEDQDRSAAHAVDQKVVGQNRAHAGMNAIARAKHTFPFQSQQNRSPAFPQPQSQAPAQRMKVVPENGYEEKMGKGNDKALALLEKLISVMSHTLKDVPGKDHAIIIEIINNGKMSPAWNHHKGSDKNPGKDEDIGVQLNRWYLEKASLGELLGMFIHEIGVHALSDKLMGMSKHGTKADYGSNILDEIQDQEEDHFNPIGGRIEKFPNEKEKKEEGRSRQADHVNLAKSLSGGKSDRARHYRTLYLNTGDSIDETLDGEERDNALKELTQSFLFDIARIAATDDGNGIALLWNTDNITELMLYFRDEILKNHGDDYKWLKTSADALITGVWPVRVWLLKQLGTMLISSNPRVQAARAGIAALGTATYVGGGVLGIASAPALMAGAAFGFSVFVLQKLFGV